MAGSRALNLLLRCHLRSLLVALAFQSLLPLQLAAGSLSAGQESGASARSIILGLEVAASPELRSRFESFQGSKEELANLASDSGLMLFQSSLNDASELVMVALPGDCNSSTSEDYSVSRSLGPSELAALAVALRTAVRKLKFARGCLTLKIRDSALVLSGHPAFHRLVEIVDEARDLGVEVSRLRARTVADP